MRGDLLFELGTEEIPAAFLARALKELPALVASRLAAARLEHGEITAIGAPRRIAVHVLGVAERQSDVSELVTGPPASAAFDKDGKPTRAAQGFAQKNGVPLEALKVVEVAGKGAYVAAQREQKGEAARALLPTILSDIAHAIPWKKSMRWASYEETFVRPVHWLVAIYSGEVVPLSLYGVVSGRESRGHRFLAPGPVVLDGTLADYRQRLRQAFVIVDPEARRLEIEAELARVQRDDGVRVRPDPELLAEVTHLVEYPKAVVGSFDERFLAIPAEVIISAMRGHQRYFATEGQGGRLAARFVTVAGTITKDPAVVRSGNERVLAARLSDARFFYEEDRALASSALASKLEGVVFQKALGTIADKVRRIAEFASAFPVDGEAFRAAAGVAKLDLVTKMVGEFPDLQGVMGRYYAPGWGATAEVADAVFEHYLPRNAADSLPPSPLGAALGIADRLDTIVGCWAVGLAPTGSADAFGLRRAALAVLNILIDRDWSLGLDRLIETAVRLHKVPVPAAAPAEILDFLKTRLRGLLVDGRNLAGDCVDAALAVGANDVPDAVRRAAAVAHLRERPDFEPLGVAFKRVANILKGEEVTGAPEAKLFTPSERSLWERFTGVQGTVEAAITAHDYDTALRELTRLKPDIDTFFDDVLVMDPNLELRQNRLRLLGRIAMTFIRIADFRQLAVK